MRQANKSASCHKELLDEQANRQCFQSIVDDFAASRQAQAELEAKALFRLLNCCLPSAAITKEASLEEAAQRVPKPA